MQVIGLQQMLAHMERLNPDNTPAEFNIIYVRGSTNPKAGTLTRMTCRKLGHAAGHNHKERGTLPLYDVKYNRPAAPVLDNILYYNGMKVLW